MSLANLQYAEAHVDTLQTQFTMKLPALMPTLTCYHVNDIVWQVQDPAAAIPILCYLMMPKAGVAVVMH